MLKVFASQRIVEIEQLSTQGKWKWFLSEFETTDLTTKLFKQDQITHDRCNVGPSFFRLGESH